ncbi:hypothetical protein KUTeg_014022 [Tegillarca granosa]|uniref:Kinesin motor domain-containing protein n=1 Tax=Tegillarca granosa TaxID=220873 RepID=A0ABQ9F0U3_TEGGR|nr:hypothetical protein KUTeg_014022 [Tegillarca granosa]
MSKIKVAVRARPLSKKEVDANSKFVTSIQGDTISVTNVKLCFTDQHTYICFYIFFDISVVSHRPIVARCIYIFFKVDSQAEFGDSRDRVKHFSYDYCYDSAVNPQSTAYASQELFPTYMFWFWALLNKLLNRSSCDKDVIALFDGLGIPSLDLGGLEAKDLRFNMLQSYFMKEFTKYDNMKIVSTGKIAKSMKEFSSIIDHFQKATNICPVDIENMGREPIFQDLGTEIFQDLGTEVLDAAFEGYNTCVLAYGQTSTGKTYTMMGNPDDPGLTPRICEVFSNINNLLFFSFFLFYGLFSHIDDVVGEKVRVDISYYEIYNERVRDLLRPSLRKGNDNSHCVRNNQEIQELLDRGQENRTTASTYMHDYSSRSHAIVTINYTQAKLEDDLPHEIVSKIHLVDLAGRNKI